jgi:FtsZ-binding cell division protein ZapB
MKVEPSQVTTSVEIVIQTKEPELVVKNDEILKLKEKNEKLTKENETLKKRVGDLERINESNRRQYNIYIDNYNQLKKYITNLRLDVRIDYNELSDIMNNKRGSSLNDAIRIHLYENNSSHSIYRRFMLNY